MNGKSIKCFLLWMLVTPTLGIVLGGLDQQTVVTGVAEGPTTSTSSENNDTTSPSPSPKSTKQENTTPNDTPSTTSVQTFSPISTLVASPGTSLQLVTTTILISTVIASAHVYTLTNAVGSQSTSTAATSTLTQTIAQVTVVTQTYTVSSVAVVWYTPTVTANRLTSLTNPTAQAVTTYNTQGFAGTQTVWVNTNIINNSNLPSSKGGNGDGTTTITTDNTAIVGGISTFVTTIGGNSGLTLTTSLLNNKSNRGGTATLVYYTTSGGSVFLVTSMVTGQAKSVTLVTLISGSSTIVTTQPQASANLAMRAIANPLVGFEKDLSFQKTLLSVTFISLFAAFNIL
ncbi:uncharacterized protein KQ657_000788 [Scheffersomyces spartinae]|uniref:Uncharacterized protein n=1 Tax=Scheffersomyces spartinae TaxID=45513 RepID=A0A9P7V973_9ASCO|nr:uncharacterized protein KQ657_000788 [Scheffersomyces spartinae]KAG7193370.1 hypothetical protein KQ657_000788 [Scheffersomyces spartinae]